MVNTDSKRVKAISTKRPELTAGRFRLCSGFTLIEMLVVMVILSIMVSMVAISTSGNFDRELRKEAERFRTVFIAAADEAAFATAEIGVFLSEKRYAFLRYDPIARGWVMMNNEPFEMHTLPENVVLRYSVEGFSRSQADGSLYGSPDYEEIELFAETEDPDTQALREAVRALEQQGVDLAAQGSLGEAIRQETIDLTPQIYTLSSGEQSAFEVEFLAGVPDQVGLIVRVESDGFSRPVVVSDSAESSDAET